LTYRKLQRVRRNGKLAFHLLPGLKIKIQFRDGKASAAD
jgi:hypothetical protein